MQTYRTKSKLLLCQFSHLLATRRVPLYNCWSSIGAPIQANEGTGSPLREIVLINDLLHDVFTLRGQYYFFCRTSFITRISSACSATRRLSFLFSSSSDFERLASDTANACCKYNSPAINHGEVAGRPR